MNQQWIDLSDARSTVNKNSKNNNGSFNAVLVPAFITQNHEANGSGSGFQRRNPNFSRARGSLTLKARKVKVNLSQRYTCTSLARIKPGLDGRLVGSLQGGCSARIARTQGDERPTPPRTCINNSENPPGLFAFFVPRPPL